jgi:cytochrome c oxidase subunit 2
MDPKLVLWIFLILAAAWTAIWLWIVVGARVSAPFGEIYARAAVLRRRLVYPAIALVLLAFGGSLALLPYPSVRAARLGVPTDTVDVASLQWAWDLSRDSLPAGVPVMFRVSAQDVNHGFGIYDAGGRLRAQVQAMPRYTNELIYRFDEPGEYTVRCLEFCGVGHHAMVATIIVVPFAGASR